MEDGQPGASEIAHRRAQRHESRTEQTYRAFIQHLCDVSGMETDQAECAAVSVLGALEQRLRLEEAYHLEAQLPFELRELLPPLEQRPHGKPVKYKRAELIRRVCADLGLSPEDGEWAIRSVFQAVRDQVSEGEIDKVMRALPEGFRDLWRPEM